MQKSKPLLRFLCDSAPGRDASTFFLEEIEEYMDWRLSGGDSENRDAPKLPTVAKEVGVIRSVLRYSRESPTNPGRDLGRELGA